MVCEKCEKKLGKVCTPDPWKAGASNTNEGGRKINENKLLSQRKNKFNPYTTTFSICRICRTKVRFSTLSWDTGGNQSFRLSGYIA